MYGKEYLDWKETERVKEKFGVFMECLDADERALLEGVLRNRYREFVPSSPEDQLRNLAGRGQLYGSRAYEAQSNARAAGVVSMFGF